MSLFPWEVDGGKSDNEVIHRVLDAAAPSGAAASGTGSAADRGTGIAASSAKQRATPAPPLSPASQSWTPVRAYASAAPAFALPGQMAPYSVGVPPPQALQYARGGLAEDREVVLAAVKRIGSALEHASDELKSDRDVVLAAVRESGFALRYASAELIRSDRVLTTYAGKGLQKLATDLEKGKHSFDEDTLEELSEAAVHASTHGKCTAALAERIAKAVADPSGPVHKRQKREWAAMTEESSLDA